LGIRWPFLLCAFRVVVGQRVEFVFAHHAEQQQPGQWKKKKYADQKGVLLEIRWELLVQSVEGLEVA
jgi:hypothetical protein